LPRRNHEQRRSEKRERPGKADGKLSGWQRAHCCARVATIVFDVGDAIHGHRGGTRTDHGDDDPADLPERRETACVARGEKRADQREWQRKNAVLELDHFEHDSQPPFLRD
jgi:hypothetical protein